MSTPKLDQFEFWLMDMDDALERFVASIPPEISPQGGYSLELLSLLEKQYLAEFPSIDVAKDPSSATRLDGYARYLGETLRHLAGGKWLIDFGDPKNAYYGLPQVQGTYGSVCPLTLVSAAADRRTGVYWNTVVGNMVKRANNG